MSIFSKIFLAILPILLCSLIGSIGINYYFTSHALKGIAENWLRVQRQELVESAWEQLDLLAQYQLEEVPASIQKAQQDTLAIIKDLDFGEQGFAFVIDAKDQVRGYPDPDLNGLYVAKAEWYEGMQEQLQGTLFIDWGKVPTYSLYTYFEPWDWFLLVSIPKSGLYRPIARSNSFVIFIAGLSTLLLALILWVVTRRVTGPLRDLARNIERIGTEGPGKTIQVTTRDEIGVVARIFNEMSHRLSSVMADLKHNERHFRALIENGSDLILVLDGDGNMSYVSPSVTRILGYQQSDLLGRQAFDFVHVDDLSKMQQRFTRLSKEGGTLELAESRFRHREGFWKHFEVNSKKMEGSSPAFVIIVNARDVSERKRIERSKLEADAANRAKSELIAHVSHDIRTPMDAILGLIRLLRQAGPNPRQLDYLNRIQRSARTLLGVINDLLDYSKIEEGKLALEAEPFPLEEVLDHVLGLFAMKITEKNLELITTISPAIPEELTGDALRLEQVLINLISNALKFTDAGEVLLNIEVLESTAHRILLRFAVRDTGRGIPGEKLGDLFQPYAQGDHTYARVYGGTGLGLAICRRLVNLMQGEIWAESQEDNGSSFFFTACFGLPTDPGLETRGDEGVGSGKKALVVHGNTHFQEMMHQGLRRYAMLSQPASDARQALRLFRSAAAAGHPFDVVFVNQHLTDEQGGALVGQIKAATEGFSTRTILMRPFGSEHEMAGAQEQGADRVLYKPVSPRSLRAALQGLHDPAGEAAPGPFREPCGGEPPAPDLSGVKILLAEDNPVNRFVQKEILESLGLQVAVVDTGREVLASLKRRRPDLVFMDIQMPDLDGLSASRHIRSEPGYADLPIIALTAFHMESEREKCLEAGMNDFITKPVQAEQLMAAVSKWVVRPKAPGPLESGGQGAGETDSPGGAEGIEERRTANPGVDVQRGLQRMNGKRHLFDKSLQIFVDSYQQASTRIGELLKEGRSEDAARYCHTMKGAAATICADRLHAVLCDLEKELKEHPPKEDIALLDDFDRELSGIVDWIHKENRDRPL